MRSPTTRAILRGLALTACVAVALTNGVQAAPFTTRFEAPTYTLGTIDGGDGWLV